MSWRARISTNLRALRLTYCPQAPAHEGIRRFVDNNYHELKKLNPQTAFLMRPSVGLASARILATYDYGVEKSVDVSQLSEKEITEQLRDLVLFGNYTAKANMFPFQAGVPKDADIVDYKGF